MAEAASSGSRKMVRRYIPVLMPEDGDQTESALQLFEAFRREAGRYRNGFSVLCATIVEAVQHYPEDLPPLPSMKPRPKGEAPDPTDCMTLEALRGCLKHLVKWAGVRNYRDLEERTREAGHPLSKSSIGRILSDKGGSLRSYEALESILYGCGLTAPQIELWTRAWSRCQREAGEAQDAWRRYMDASDWRNQVGESY